MGTTKPVKTCVIGCGDAAQHFHLPWLVKIKNVLPVAVCDSNIELAKKVAAKFHIDKYYGNYEQMIDKESPEVIDICTSPRSHAALSIQAMNMGCHVLIEKPMSASLAEADQMIETANKNNVKLCIIHNQLFSPSILKAISMVTVKGVIGDITGIDSKILTTKNNPGIRDKNHWCHSLPGGPFGEELAHPIYSIMRFVGNIEPVAVYAKKVGNCDWITADELRVILKGQHCLATITSSLNWPKYKSVMDISGTKGNMHVDIRNSAITVCGTYGNSLSSRALENLQQSYSLLAGTTSSTIKMLIGKCHTGHYTLIERFFKAVQDDTMLPVTADEGREVMRVYESVIAKMEKLGNS
jgi:predicted dehydrogenase